MTQQQQPQAPEPGQNNTHHTGPGYITKFIDGTTKLVILLLTLAAIAGVGYYLYTNPETLNQLTAKTEEQPHQSNPLQDQAQPKTAGQTPEADDTKTNPNDGHDEINFFDDLGTPRNPPPPDAPTQATQTPEHTAPEPKPAPVPNPITAETNLETLNQIDSLEKLLVQLSQFTRKEYPQTIRANSVDGMTKALNQFPDALQIIKARNPTLADQITNVINQYAQPTIDAKAMRNQIKRIREQLNTFR